MARTDLEWVVSQVAQWRKEAGVKEKIDSGQLASALARIAEAGEPEDQVLFVVLGSEWLFRQKKIGKAEVDEALAKIETGLRGSMHELAWVVTEALKPRVSQLLRRESRVLPAFGLYRRQDLLRAQLQRGRSRPKRLAPPRRGPLPWPAPLIAGVIVAKQLETDDTKDPELALDLVSVLRGGEFVDLEEFKKRRKRLEGSDLDGLADQFSRSFVRYFGAAPDGPQLSEESFSYIGTVNLFPVRPEVVLNLFEAYSGRATEGRQDP